MMPAQHRRAHILLVEDNPADVRLTVEALKETTLPLDLSVAHDGDEALEFLHQRGNFAGVVAPDLVLLDLNLPGIDGFEVLEATKSDQTLRHIPIIVMTTSRSEDDIHACYQLHANGYIAKPVGVHRVAAALESIYDFWFSTALLPNGVAPVRF